MSIIILLIMRGDEMKIIKHGNPSKVKKNYKFICKACGCEYEAEESELLKEEGDGIYPSYRYTNCPDCGRGVSLDYEINSSY